MSMTTSQVLDLINKNHESNTNINETERSITPEVTTNSEAEATESIKPEVDNTDTTTSDPVETEDKSKGSEDVAVTESPAESVIEPKKESKANAVQAQKDKEIYAFKKLKAKEKEKRNRLISEYENKIRQYEEELNRYRGLQKTDFKSEEDYINHVVNQRMWETSAEHLKAAKAQIEAEEFDAIHAQRVENCFPDEKDRATYNKLIQDHGRDFLQLLNENDPDGAILEYLDDSDYQPLLLRVLMTRPEYREEIFNKRNPSNKIRAMEALENKIKYAQNVIAKRRANAVAAPQSVQIPVVGKVAKGDSQVAPVQKDFNYYNDMLKKLNSRKY